MRALLTVAAVCLLAACTSAPTRVPVVEDKPAAPRDALAEARARNQHWLEPALVDAFPAAVGDYRAPQRLAVLLPQSGNLSAAAASVRDGLLAAYYAETRAKPTVRFYDTQGTAAGAGAAFARARKDGAQMVIGPIGKDEAAAVAALADGMPVLVLNKIDGPRSRFLLDFSLTPEREGELLAERLLADKILEAAVFVEGDDAAQRTFTAFEDAYRLGGGVVVAKAPVPHFGKDATGGAVNPSLPDSLSRAKGVLLLMSGTAAKPTRAALALNGAGQLPLYAGSDITDNADPKSNAQLDGIRFPQLPWLGGRGNALNLSAASLAKLPSARGAGARLNAFGADAWLIATRLHLWLKNPNGPINGATGTLHLEPDGEIERRLPWAVFRGGVPQADVR